MRKVTLLIVALVMILSMAAMTANAATSDPTCVGSLPNRLAAGDTGQISQRFSTLRTSPGSSGKAVNASENLTFQVLEPAKCTATGPLWWLHVQYSDGREGWLAESQVTSIWGNNQYWVEKVEAAPTAG